MPADLRPLSLGELLDRTFFLYRKNFLLFVGIVALPHLGLMAVQFANLVMRSQRVVVGFSLQGILWTAAIYLIMFGVAGVSQGATSVAVSKLHLGNRVSIGESFAGIKNKVFYLWALVVLQFLGVMVGIVLLIIPGIILGLMWMLTVQVAAIEDGGFFNSFARSAALTKGHRGRGFVICLIFVAVLYAATLLWAIPMGIFVVLAARGGHGAQPLWFLIAAPIGSFFSQCLAGPLMTIGLSLFYYDERVRKEAFDLQHMMTTLDDVPSNTLPAAGV